MADPVSDTLIASTIFAGGTDAAAAGGLGALAGGAAAAGAAGAGVGLSSLLAPALVAGTVGASAMIGQKPKPDPNLTEAQQRALQDNIDALQVQMQGDTASLLARYGQRVAMANAQGTAAPAAMAR